MPLVRLSSRRASFQRSADSSTGSPCRRPARRARHCRRERGGTRRGRGFPRPRPSGEHVAAGAAAAVSVRSRRTGIPAPRRGNPQTRPRSQSARGMQIAAAPGGGGPVGREKGRQEASGWTAGKAAVANGGAERAGRAPGAESCKFSLKRGREIRVSREALGA